MLQWSNPIPVSLLLCAAVDDQQEESSGVFHLLEHPLWPSQVVRSPQVSNCSVMHFFGGNQQKKHNEYSWLDYLYYHDVIQKT